MLQKYFNKFELLSAIKPILNKFDSVSLEEIEQVKLMNRIDRKYWFHISKLEPLLNEALPWYNVLEINNHRLMEYRTTYFDTPDDKMYLTHHNKKLNRYKVRRRKYNSNDCTFFEIKFKNNKKRTIKKRIKSVFEAGELHDRESHFLTGNTPFESSMLQPGLYNQFYRITLIHKKLKDRCTIDLKPEFRNGHGKLQYDDLVIFELKRSKSMKSSPMIYILKALKIRQRGLSKYCTGKALLDPQLKRNAFKPRLRFLQKM